MPAITTPAQRRSISPFLMAHSMRATDILEAGRLWRQGNDTHAIAFVLRVHESVVMARIHEIRQAARRFA
jgi:hypothetical protein